MTLLLTFIIIFIGAGLLISGHSSELRHSKGMAWGLFFYHTFFTLVYYIWSLSNNSDSRTFYAKVITNQRGDSMADYYGFGTLFIEWITYPFAHFLGFTYLDMMFLYGFFGFVGFFYLYLLIAERTTFRHKLLGIDVLVLVMFLPIAHFYSSSLGKGSIILGGIGLLFYGLNDMQRRLPFLILGAIVVTHVRAHVMAVICFSAVVAVIFSSSGIKGWQKALIITVALAGVVPLIQQSFDYAGVEEASLEQATAIADKRAQSNTKANSAVPLDQYSQPMRIFTFLFRPLFIDTPNALGLIVSCENVIYLFLFLRTFSPTFLRYIARSPWLIKMAFCTFWILTFALAQISSNMGIATRQKSQVTYLFMLVLLGYADYAYREERKLVIGE
jgi:hypothetical protein